MNATIWKRWSPLAGLVYAVTYVVGFILIVGEEIDEKSDTDLIAYYADSGNRSGDVVGLLLVAIGLLFFLVFVSVLRERLRSAEADGSGISAMVGAAGVAAATLFMAGSAASSATSVGAGFIDDLTVDPDSARLLLALGFALLVGAVVFSCGLVLATSALALRGTVLPAWIGWLGFVAIVLAVIETFLFPLFVIPAWALIVSIVLVTRTPRT
jgi:Domain of unknown function (DUF4386)